jgi:hypothetical protein
VPLALVPVDGSSGRVVAPPVKSFCSEDVGELDDDGVEAFSIILLSLYH